MWKCYLQYLVREKIYLFITHFVNVFTPTLLKITNKQKSIVRPLAHRHCLFVLWKKTSKALSLLAVGLGLRPVTSFFFDVNRWRYSVQLVWAAAAVGGCDLRKRENNREIKCRRRVQKEKESKRIPKRNVCCDNYFLFWEIATSIGYLQVKKNTKLENIKQNKKIAGPSPTWRRKGES